MPNPIVLNEDDPDERIELPTRYEVCDRCRGEGNHDAWEGGMTASEMAEQGDEFFEDYMAGMYAVPCSECNGNRVVAVVDENRCPPEHLAAWRAYEQDEAEYHAMAAAERRAGC